MKESELRDIAYARMSEGRQIADNAAHGGEMTDRGGGAMISEAEAFIAGLNKTLPSHWQSFVDEKAREEKQERREYERLKAKYEPGSKFPYDRAVDIDVSENR